MKKLLLMLMFAPGLAFAAGGNGSEFLWQSPAGKWEVTPFLTYRSQEVQLKGGLGDIKSTGTRFGLIGEYGISEMLSTGLQVSTVSMKTENPAPAAATKSSGMEDVLLFLKGRIPVGMGSFRFGANLGFSAEKRKVKAGGDSNAASGGMSLAPFVGYEIDMAPMTFGARISHQIFTGDRTETDESVTPATESKTTDGGDTEFALFYEHDMNPAKFGVALEITASGKEEWKSNGVTTTNASGYTLTGLRFYVPYTISEMATIIPTLKYAQFTAMPGGYDSAHILDIGVGARFSF